MGKVERNNKGNRDDKTRPDKTIEKRKKFYKPKPKKEFPKKYQTVRFFEKRKILRKIEQYEKRIATAKLLAASPNGIPSDSPSVEDLQNELEKWNKDLIYVNFFPKKEKYISLFPKSDPEQSEEQRTKMRAKAEQIAARIEERKEQNRIAQAKRTGRIPDSSESDDSDSEDDIKQELSEEEQEEQEEDDFFL